MRITIRTNTSEEGQEPWSETDSLVERVNYEGQLLQWLAWGHYLVAALTLISFLWLGYGYYSFGRLVSKEPDVSQEVLHQANPSYAKYFEAYNKPEDRVVVAYGLILLGLVSMVLAIVHAVALWFVGWSLAQRKRRLLCLIFSWLDLTYVPLGLALSIFTLIVLYRPGVKQLFVATKGGFTPDRDDYAPERDDYTPE